MRHRIHVISVSVISPSRGTDRRVPKPAEFEEKEYETPLYRELSNGRPEVWQPGQVLEGHIGIDAALWAGAHRIWGLLGRPTTLPGVELAGSTVTVAFRELGAGRAVPDFSVNLFVQAKRPERMSRRTGGLKDTSLRSPYWRFSIRRDQQEALEAIAAATKEDAAVVYASPAFDTIDGLTKHMLAGNVSDQSTFVEAADLTGHKYWAYDRPGSNGFRCSTPEPCSGTPFDDLIGRLSDRARRFEGPTPEAALATVASLAETVQTSLRERLGDTPRIRMFLSVRERLMAQQEMIPLTRPVRDYLELSFLLHVLGISWFVIG